MFESNKQVNRKKADGWHGLSLSHAKVLIKRLSKRCGDISLVFQALSCWKRVTNASAILGSDAEPAIEPI